MTRDERWTPEQWLIWRAEQDATRPIVTVLGGAADGADTWTAEEWRIWREEEEATPPAAAVHGGAADGDDHWTPEEWRIWREEEEQEAMHPVAAAPGGATGLDERWTSEERRVWRAMQEAPPPDGAAPDETAAPAPLPASHNELGSAEAPAAGSEPPNWAVIPVTPKAAPMIPLGDLLLRSFAGRWSGSHAFVAADWITVSSSLQQHGVELPAEAPALSLGVPWANMEFWRPNCWWCCEETNPGHNNMECPRYIEALSVAFQQLLDRSVYASPRAADGGNVTPVLPVAPAPVPEGLEEDADVARLMIADAILEASAAGRTVEADEAGPPAAQGKGRPKGGPKKMPLPKQKGFAKGSAPCKAPAPDSVPPPPAAGMNWTRPPPHRVPKDGAKAKAPATTAPGGPTAEGPRENDQAQNRPAGSDPVESITCTSTGISGAAAVAGSRISATDANVTNAACLRMAIACTTPKTHRCHLPRGLGAATGIAAVPPREDALVDGELHRQQAHREHRPAARPLRRSARLAQCQPPRPRSSTWSFRWAMPWR